MRPQITRIRQIAQILPVLFAVPIAGCSERSAEPPAQEGMAGMDMSGGGTGGMDMSGDGPIRVSTRQASLAGVTFAVAREAPVERTVRAVAMAVPNERGLAVVNTRVRGWVEELHADETGRQVRAGEALLDLYAPELVTAQEELLLARRLVATTGGDSLLAAARRRLALWNVHEDDIRGIEQSGEVRRRLTLRAPRAGHLMEKNVIEGQMVQAGERLFRIADLTTIWIEPAIFETDIPLVRIGQRARVHFDALPDRVFEGRVTFIHPELDMRTRTLRIRVEVSNRDLAVRPMMYGTVRLDAEGPRGIIVPLTAVLPTGTRDLAFVVRNGGIVPTEVTVGMRGDSTIIVVDGLMAGDTVVASATFLFDSESQLAAAMAGIMLNMGMGLDMGGMDDMDGMDGMPTPADSTRERRP